MHLVAELSLEATPAPNTVLVFLEDAVKLTGLRAVCEPIVVAHEEGICGFVMIAESHISFSCHRLKGHIDIFSCRDFSHRGVKQLVEHQFRPLGIMVRLLQRTAGKDIDC